MDFQSPQSCFPPRKIATPESRNLRRQRFPLLLLAIFTVIIAARADAQSSYTWTGGGGTNGGNWTTAANWGGTAPSSPQAYLNFAGTVETTTTNNFAAYSAGFQIYFNSGAGPFILSGSAINFYDYSGVNPVIENDSTSTQTVNFQVDMEDSVSGAVMNINATKGNINLGQTSGNGFLYASDVTGDSLVLNTGTGNTITQYGIIGNGNATNAVTISGSGTVILAGSNTFTGATTINGGATLQLGTGSTTGQDLNTSGFVDNGTLVIDRSGNVTQKAGSSLGGAISGTGAVIIESGTALYSASSSNFVNTYSGNTTVQTGGALNLALSLSIENSALNTSGGGYVTLTPTTVTVGGLYGSTNLSTFITTGYSSLTALTLNPGAGYSNTYSGAIANGAAGMALIKSGSGMQTLSGASTYTGATTVSAGTLVVSGSLAGTSAMTVASGATLEIDGSSNGSSTTTVNGAGYLQGNGKLGAIAMNGGTLAPGLTAANATTAVGVLTAAGSVSLSSTSTFAVRLGYGGSNSADELVTTGAFSITTGATLVLTLNNTTMQNATIGQVYVIANAGSAPTGSFGSSITSGGYSFNILYDVNSSGQTGTGSSYDDIDLQLTAAVPEPGAAGMFFAGIGILLCIRGLRKRQAGA